MPQTQVLIRVQARGGKFLGPAVQYAEVSVWNGGQCIYGPCSTSGPDGNYDSGVVNETPNAPFAAASSRDVIFIGTTVPGGPPAGAYQLSSDGPSAGVVASFHLDAPALLEFRATTQSGVTTSTMMWMYPGLTLTNEPGLLLEIPGLDVTDIRLQAGPLPAVNFSATVRMMCGCPISTPTWPPTKSLEPYWPCYEFDVRGVLISSDGELLYLPMQFTAENTFSGEFQIPPTGKYTLGVYAVQQAEANAGYAQIGLTVVNGAEPSVRTDS